MIYKVDIGRPTKKGSEVIFSLFCDSNLPDTKIREIYMNRYKNLDVTVDRVEQPIEEMNVKGIQENSSFYGSSPSHYFKVDSLPKKEQALVKRYLELVEEETGIKKELEETFKRVISYPNQISINDKSVTVYGRFKDDLLSRVKPLPKEEDNED